MIAFEFLCFLAFWSMIIAITIAIIWCCYCRSRRLTLDQILQGGHRPFRYGDVTFLMEDDLTIVPNHRCQFEKIDWFKIRSIILNWGNEIWTWKPVKLPLLEEWILIYNGVPVLVLPMRKVFTMLDAGFIVDIGTLKFMSTC